MASEGIFQYFGSGGGLSFGTLATYGLWFMVLLTIGLSITFIVVLFIVKKTSTQFVEIDHINKRVRNFAGRSKKQKLTNLRKMWVGKLKKFLPPFQQNDIFMKKTSETVFLLKDKNGMHHTLRVPSWPEIKKWYKVVYDLDIDKDSKDKNVKKLRAIYFMPNRHEDLTWLENQVVESNESFADVWWKHPNIVVIGALALSAFVFIMTLIISKKM